MEQLERPGGVGVVAPERIGQGARHGRDGRFVKDELDAVERAGERRLIPDVGLDELDVLADVGEVLAPPRREVVDHAHAVAAGDQRARQG